METWEPAECRECAQTIEDGVAVCEVCRLCEDCHEHAMVVPPRARQASLPLEAP